MPLANSTFVYGPWASDGRFWDESRVYACHCESSWPVGLGAGETQEPEYFGPSCDNRHCPSGDDPQTPQDETDCYNVTASRSTAKGLFGNKCHVDCSNRGECNYATGICKCYPGFTGHNCHTRVEECK